MDIGLLCNPIWPYSLLVASHCHQYEQVTIRLKLRFCNCYMFVDLSLEEELLKFLCSQIIDDTAPSHPQRHWPLYLNFCIYLQIFAWQEKLEQNFNSEIYHFIISTPQYSTSRSSGNKHSDNHHHQITPQACIKKVTNDWVSGVIINAAWWAYTKSWKLGFEKDIYFW